MKLRNLLLAGLLCLLPFSLFANPIKGLLERIEAGASKKFIIQLQKNADTDFFELDQKGDFNYCTYSYTMAFWDWARWEKEIDWMALHGINLPLAAVGQECVWRNMLAKLGYTKEETNRFIAGPAFLAWWAMNNLEGWGGPNPDSWYTQQEALQKKILKRMREYGIEPVLPGYYS